MNKDLRKWINSFYGLPVSYVPAPTNEYKDCTDSKLNCRPLNIDAKIFWKAADKQRKMVIA